MLQLIGLSKRYPDGDGNVIVALDRVNMTLSPGEFLALYGPSGSGKTTLLSIVASLLAPDDGSVVFEGREIARLSRSDAARYRLRDIGYIRQNPDFLDGVPAGMQAAEKLFGLGRTPRKAVAEVKPLLEDLGLGSRLGHLPGQLSAGERQRIAIARALAPGPRLLLADEPTGALDTARSREVLQLLRDLCTERRVALLLVTHDPQAASFADISQSLVDGQLLDHVPESVVHVAHESLRR